MERCQSPRIALLCLLACAAAACSSSGHSQPPTKRSPSTASTPAPVPLASHLTQPFPGPGWTRNGRPVSSDVLDVSGGPEHCDWQDLAFVTATWPLGSAPHGTNLRQYIRVSPAQARMLLNPKNLAGPLRLQATLPKDAVDTGYRSGTVHLWLSPSDQDRYAYLVSGTTVEAWPRSIPLTLCD